MDNIIQMFDVSDETCANGLTTLNHKYSSDDYPSCTPTLDKHRTSHYTIYADLPNSDDLIIVHGYLGYKLKVTKEVGDYLRSLESKSPSRPLYGEWSDVKDPAYPIKIPDEDTLEKLKSKGFLTLRSFEEELSFFRQYVDLKAKKQFRKMPFYLFMPTYDCNLRCPYCFQDHMRKDESFKSNLKLMTKETVDKIFDAMPSIEEKHGFDKNNPNRKREISFFGGEPFLKQNKEIVAYIMDKAKKHGGGVFSGVTNATELEHYEDLLGDGGISEIQITLDGKPSEHDKRRIYPDGAGSFDLIAKNIKFALERKVFVSLRLNIDFANVNDLPEVAQLIMDEGWDQYDHFGVYLAAIRPGNDDMDSSTCMTTRQLNHEMKRLRAEYPTTKIFTVDGDKLLNKAQSVQLDNDDIGGLKTQYCSAHSRMYLFDLHADIYACWEQTGDSKIKIGGIEKEGRLVLNREAEQDWRSRSVASNKVCAQCRYAVNCGGGCAILAQERTGTLHSNDCDSFGKRFRESVAEAYLAQEVSV